MDSIPSAKELKRLADACRKAGIASFKGCGIEISLADTSPQPQTRRKRSAASTPQVSALDAAKPFISDSLSDEDLLLWSVGGGEPLEDPTGIT